ncbi:hypothetical protein NM208_g4205 [Fusarium decemcellulare]|uniref:Uncharacterized protein n=1 Tax=Fusarium decemcellulare TaxID=57161 RepID=A0ACC1SLF2_9HYPO|nr:hypothetical protein NM208_g4205 [Fusarium decemcellulare]
MSQEGQSKKGYWGSPWQQDQEGQIGMPDLQVSGPGSEESSVTRHALLALNAPAPAAYATGPSVARNVHERRGFDWFLSRTSKKIPGVFEPEFWKTLVLQASATEPAVFHAAVALGAAHRREMLLATETVALVPDEQECFMLRQYNTAISHLQSHLAAGVTDKDSAHVAAIACMLFICLEFLRGNYKTGNTHLRNGLFLLHRLQAKPDSQDKTLVLPSHHQSLLGDLVEVFTRLYVQSAFFGAVSDPFTVAVCHDQSDTQFSSFPSIEMARRHLDELLNRVFRLTEQCRNMPTLSHPISISTLLDDQQDIRACLETWLRLYHASQGRMTAKADDQLQISLACRLLLVYHSMACIMAETCIAPTNESVFDCYNSEFASIVDQCMDLWRSASQMMAEDLSSGHCTHRFSFSADMGFILPLYYTGLKCREPETRRAALALLLSAPHQEGVWNGRLAACVVQRVITIEERDYSSDSGVEQTVPESDRIHGVQMELSDCATTKAVLSYKIRQANGTLVTRQEDIDWD